MERVLSADIETFSDVDLIKCGVYAYADSPAFEILLFAYSFDGGETQIIDLAQGEKLPAEVEEAIFDVSVTKTAYNANFGRKWGCPLPMTISWRANPRSRPSSYFYIPKLRISRRTGLRISKSTSLT